MKKAAVVILNWNGKHYLEDFLPSVVAFSLFENTEVVVIDNGSTDDSIDFLKKEFNQIMELFNKRNYQNSKKKLDKLGQERIKQLFPKMT